MISVRFVALLLGAAALVPVVPAAADVTVHEDGDEEPFCEDGNCSDGDYMDFRRLTQGHGATHRKVSHGIFTAKEWSTRQLGGRHGVTFLVYLDIDRDAATEREVRIRVKNGSLWAGMFDSEDRTPVPGRIRVRRPDPDGVEIVFSADLLRDGIAGYRWSVGWYSRGLSCPGGCSTDTAPDQGRYTHQL